MTLNRRQFVAATVAASAATVAPVTTLRAGAQAGPAQHMVEIHKFKFSPDRLTVQAGDTITWINMDVVPHTATADDESWDTGKIKKGERKRVVVGDNFRGSYFCRYHRTMSGTITVGI